MERLISIVQLITAVATAITVVIALVKSFHNGRKIDSLIVQVDGNLAQMLALTASSNLAKGRADERSDVAAELAARNANAARGPVKAP